MSQKIRAKIVNGTLVPLEPLGIEEGANVVFVLVSKAPPGVEPNMRDYVGYSKMKLPSEIDEELFIEEYLEKERRIKEQEQGKFRVTPHYGKFLAGSDPKSLKRILEDEDVESYLKGQGDSK